MIRRDREPSAGFAASVGVLLLGLAAVGLGHALRTLAAAVAGVLS